MVLRWKLLSVRERTVEEADLVLGIGSSLTLIQLGCNYRGNRRLCLTVVSNLLAKDLSILNTQIRSLTMLLRYF